MTLRAAACRIAFVGGSRDEFCNRGTLEQFIISLPHEVWLRTLDTDHFFSEELGELAQACGDVMAWFEGGNPEA